MLKKIITIIILLILFFKITGNFEAEPLSASTSWWKYQSVDTMKFSRDLAREKLNDPTFSATIDAQVKAIKDTGATHISIDTPYDDEFLPFLKRWVEAARRNNLNVWFRGNWSGWEGWFDYPKITREEHIKKTQEFIKNNSDLFADGDIFTACPECENGGPGDPRKTRDVKGYRKFMIDEYAMTKDSFKSIDKVVVSNFDSMNGDVARLIMDEKTTIALDGVVTIDHYVKTPDQLVKDIKEISQVSGGRIVLGEFGAPIPDINGKMTDQQQAAWIKEALIKLVKMPEVRGLNYWTNMGSSTALWRDDGSAKPAVSVVKSVYGARIARGVVKDEGGWGIQGAYITIEDRHYFTNAKGEYSLPFFGYKKATIDAQEFYGTTIDIDPNKRQVTVLKKENESLLFKIRHWVNDLFGKI